MTVTIGAILISVDGLIISRAHNRVNQDNDPTAHACSLCIRSAGRRIDWKDLTLVMTSGISPSSLGNILQYGLRKVILGETTENYTIGSEGRAPQMMQLLWAEKVRVTNLHDLQCTAWKHLCVKERPELWSEFMGISDPAL